MKLLNLRSICGWGWHRLAAFQPAVTNSPNTPYRDWMAFSFMSSQRVRRGMNSFLWFCLCLSSWVRLIIFFFLNEKSIFMIFYKNKCFKYTNWAWARRLQDFFEHQERSKIQGLEQGFLQIQDVWSLNSTAIHSMAFASPSTKTG